MRRQALVAAMTAVLGLTIGSWLLLRKPAPRVATGSAAPAAVPAVDAPSTPTGPPALPTLIDVLEPNFSPDTPIEVTLEVFDDKGHAAGQVVELQSPPCPSDGGEALGVTLKAMTNMMGFARIKLTPGPWEVENFRSAPSKIEVAFDQTSFVLRKTDSVAGTIEGTVVDDQSRPVAGARVVDPRPSEQGRSKRRHQPPQSDLEGLTDDHGRFVLRTFEPSMPLVATRDERTSRQVIATAGTTTTQLRLFTPAWARFTSACPWVFVQYEHSGDLVELSVRNAAEAMIAAGARSFHARCQLRGQLLSATTEVEIKPGEHAQVVFDFKPMEGLTVRVVDATGVALPGVTVLARGGIKPDAVATTDLTGTAVLVPTLGSYDPLVRLELGGAWRTQREQSARLGDRPVDVVAVPSAAR